MTADPVPGPVSLRRLVHRLALGVAFSLVLIACQQGPERSTASERAGATNGPSAADGMSILVVLTDDQAFDAIGDPSARATFEDAMPFLASSPEGHWVELTQAVTSTPQCCPARATVLTGQDSNHHGVENNRRADTFELEDPGATETIATWLDRAGYRTGLVGKYLNGYPFGLDDGDDLYQPPGWDTWAAFRDTATGSAEGAGYYDYELNVDGRREPHGDDVEDYSTTVLTDHAVRFLDSMGRCSSTAPCEPFLLLFTPNAPHKPFLPRPDHADLDIRLPGGDGRSPSFDAVPEPDPPTRVPTEPLGPEATARLDEQRLDSYRTLRAVDEGIAELFDALEAAGRLDRTVVIFATDNALAFGEHRWDAEKLCPYEECVRTRFLVRWPEGPAGTRTSAAPVSLADLAPTIADLTGVEPGVESDGASLVPVLDGSALCPAGPAATVLLWGGGEDAKGKDRAAFEGVRTGSWKYVRYPNAGERELFDLVEDPFELVDRSEDPAVAAVVDELDALTDELLLPGRATTARGLAACPAATATVP